MSCSQRRPVANEAFFVHRPRAYGRRCEVFLLKLKPRDAWGFFLPDRTLRVASARLMQPDSGHQRTPGNSLLSRCVP